MAVVIDSETAGPMNAKRDWAKRAIKLRRKRICCWCWAEMARCWRQRAKRLPMDVPILPDQSGQAWDF